MTERNTTPPHNLPAIPTDRARFYVACFKLARALDVTIDQSTPDHEIVELLAEKVTPALAEAFRKGYARAVSHDNGHIFGTTLNPFDNSPLLGGSL